MCFFVYFIVYDKNSIKRVGVRRKWYVFCFWISDFCKGIYFFEVFLGFGGEFFFFGVLVR